ncbi:MAG TPA: flagellin [Bryobacteraceae bacterium]
MISTVDPSSELFLADINRTQQRIADASRQVSSGKRITAPSDAPDQVSILLQLRAQQLHNRQVQSNLVLAKANTDAADSALSSAIKLMDAALTVADQGASLSGNTTSRQNLAQQVASLQAQMVQISLTTVQGKYIFSGDQDSSPSYVLDLSPPAPPKGTTAAASNGVDPLLYPSATRQMEDPAGGSFSANKTAYEIFDNGRTTTGFAADNVFAALNNLRLALLSDDTSQVANTIGSIKTASAHLNAMEAFYGNVQNRIQSADNYASTNDISLRTQISQVEDADVTSAALELTQSTTELQAAFQMRAKMPHNSLFDFMG